MFGSWARGQADEDSDVDVAILLDRVPSRFAEVERTSKFGSDLSLNEGRLVTFFFVPEADFRAGRYAIYRAIRDEGIPV